MSFLNPTDEELAQRAMQKIKSGEALKMNAAIGKAFAGVGITDALVLKRRMPIVARILQRKRAEAARAKRLSRQIAERIGQ